MGKQHKETDEKESVSTNPLDSFSAMSDSELSEGTSTYHKFTTPGEHFDGLFCGIENRKFDEEKNPDKITKCAILEGADGSRHLFAQTIVVNELEKKWDETKETGFPVRIKFVGIAKAGTPDQYQNYRLFFAPVK